MAIESTELTLILEQVEHGNREAADRLYTEVYEQLRELASRQMRWERKSHTLQSTALVNEAWLRLMGNREGGRWQNRGHFFAAASLAMRRILVDAAKHRLREKRGGQFNRLSLDEQQLSTQQDLELVALDEALEQLREQHATKAELVELRFFGGFTNKQAAERLGVSTATAERYWVFAKAWLRSRIDEE